MYAGKYVNVGSCKKYLFFVGADRILSSIIFSCVVLEIKFHPFHLSVSFNIHRAVTLRERGRQDSN